MTMIYFLKSTARWSVLKKDCPEQESGETLRRCCLIFRDSAFWIWAAVMAGTVSMPWNTGRFLRWVWIFPVRCWRWPGKRPRIPGYGMWSVQWRTLISPDESFDVVLSSLAFHYVESFSQVVDKVRDSLAPGGYFVFSVEHPVFTAYGSQDWYYDENGNILHFPVDNYYYEGKRKAVFLGEEVVKYHRTLTTYLNTLLTHGFELSQVVEPQPPESMLHIPGMLDEMRRPMMLIVSARKRS